MHDWTEEEDLMCAEKYVKAFVIEYLDIPPYDFCRELYTDLGGNISKSSIGMKLSNIKHILKLLQVYDTFETSPLTQYSKQCLFAVVQVLKKNNIKTRIKL